MQVLQAIGIVLECTLYLLLPLYRVEMAKRLDFNGRPLSERGEVDEGLMQKKRIFEIRTRSLQESMFQISAYRL